MHLVLSAAPSLVAVPCVVNCSLEVQFVPVLAAPSLGPVSNGRKLGEAVSLRRPVLVTLPRRQPVVEGVQARLAVEAAVVMPVALK